MDTTPPPTSHRNPMNHLHKPYPSYPQLDLPGIGRDIGAWWKEHDVFRRSVQQRSEALPFVFYEGPPSANGIPGIHHVMARTIKDIFCRYQTMAGRKVERKSGWDTHGLPVELQVEKKLGIRRDDIGNGISIEDYNRHCRADVMAYTEHWERLTEQMGYWVDLENPYITYTPEYIESVWWLLKQLFDKNLLYKGHSIQPYSPAAGTGLSSHELNQPGAYREVKDTSAVVQLRLTHPSSCPELADLIEKFLKPLPEGWATNGDGEIEKGERVEEKGRLNADGEIEKGERVEEKGRLNADGGIEKEEISDAWLQQHPGFEPEWGPYLLAWTTTPWTLPSNTALAVGADIPYTLIATHNPYTRKPVLLIMAEARLGAYLTAAEEVNGTKADPQPDTGSPFPWPATESGSKALHWMRLGTLAGKNLCGLRYEQLLPYARPESGDAFRVVAGDFVRTDDGTGIVHLAPSFGADDYRTARQEGIGSLTLVDRNGRFTGQVNDPLFPLQGMPVKDAYLDEDERAVQLRRQQEALAGIIPNLTKLLSADELITLKLKRENRAFRIEKYAHSYPHCWRTDKPVLYYPLESWFIRTTAVKERMVELNQTIQWKPESTGSGRFGHWLQNLVDWNLSRSRYWGTPLPIWSTADGSELRCIGSLGELRSAMEEARAAGFDNPETIRDLHRPYVDQITLVGSQGQPMHREPDLIDVWFDSGAMPYAQGHYPFEEPERIDRKTAFPADFIAEGVDQTRGWFFTLHALAVMLFDSVAFKAVVSNGLVLDKDGNKMSKRLGNTVDPYLTLQQFGPDATRWYMVGNAQPWDNLKFDPAGIQEVSRKFFGTLHNTYSFFALYANIDAFDYREAEVSMADRPEIDRWIVSLLNSLVASVQADYRDYEPTRAARSIQTFVDEHLSNWYVRLCRRRFWKGGEGLDKQAAYQTLYTCLETVARLMAPIAPFYAERLYRDLNETTGRHPHDSVHLCDFPTVTPEHIDLLLEQRMFWAQEICSLALSLRKRSQLKVRQPLRRLLIPLTDEDQRRQIMRVADLIRSELNLKEIEFLSEEQAAVIVRKARANFKSLGPRYPALMKSIAAAVPLLTQADLMTLEHEGAVDLNLDGTRVTLERADVEIMFDDIPGWLVASDGMRTVALDIELSQELMEEGMARELVNRIQKLRKDLDFEVTDRIELRLEHCDWLRSAVDSFSTYICGEILATRLVWVDQIGSEGTELSFEEGSVIVSIKPISHE